MQFSLVGIPLKAYPAVRTRDLPSGHLLHADCGQRIRYAKQCPVHGAVDGAASAGVGTGTALYAAALARA